MRIAARFNGPPGSANGGITCGLLAQVTGGDEVTLRRPPPLETDLRVDGHELYDGEVLIASSAAAVVDLEVPPTPSVDAARSTASSYQGLSSHPFPTCYSCGSAREAPESLGLRPGPLAPGRSACTWTPQDDSPVMVWAALDCPGGWATDIADRPMVLGRMALRLDALPVAGEEHVVQGWVIAEDGRKTTTGTALHRADGRLLALARATWITLPPDPA